MAELPEPYDYCYEWNGPWGTRKFSAASHNGRRPDKSVPLFTADQLRDYAAAKVAEAVEASPEFTDAARAALLWVLWHHQGGSSPVGQPIRFALGMGAHEPMGEHQVAQAKRWAGMTRSTTAQFHEHRQSAAIRGTEAASRGET